MSLRNPRALPPKSVLSIAITGLLLGSGAQAATITVTSNADDDGTGCTLREAIASINTQVTQDGCVATGTYGDDDTILLDTLVTGAITLNGNQLAVNQSMRIQGPGAANLAVDGNAQSRVFDISGAGVAVSIDGLTIRNGLASGGDRGGGIRVQDNTSLELSNSTVSGNSANSGGGIAASNNASVTLTNTTVSGNSVAFNGGGIHAQSGTSVTLTDTMLSGNAANLGGGILAVSNNAPVMLINSTVSGNSAAAYGGGGIAAGYNSPVILINSTISGNSAPLGGGIYTTRTSMTLTNSTVSGNSALLDGGGIGAEIGSLVTLTNSTVSGNSAARNGGGIRAQAGTSMTLTNSTVSGNSANFGGGIYALQSTVTLTNSTVSSNWAGIARGGVSADRGSVTLTNSTVSGNSAGNEIGGIVVRPNTSVTLTNTLLAGNNTDCLNEVGSTVSGQFNLIGNASSACGLTNGPNGNIIGADPVIGPLADNGCLTQAGNPNGPLEFYGCVQTHALLTGSPAIDVATSNGAPTTDQRGVARPQGGGFDIGAFELGPPAQPTNVTANPGPGQATISWTPPSHTGTGPLLSCTATAEPDGASCTDDAGANQCTISGLSPEQEYSFTVTCTNAQNITSFISTASDPVSPHPEPRPVPAISALGLLAGSGLLGLLGAWRLRRQTRGHIRQVRARR